LPSETPVENPGTSFPTLFSHSQYPELSCLSASLANILADCEPGLAERVALDVPITVPNIHHLAIWVYKNMKDSVHIQHCLPRDLRGCSPRDPSNQTPSILKQKAVWRLDWLLRQDSGKFVCTVLASDEKSVHVVGIDTARCAIFDHEDTRTLPLTQSGFNACCGGTDTCICLGEVREVVIQLEGLKKRIFEEIE
jgi:hypothetical protein